MKNHGWLAMQALFSLLLLLSLGPQASAQFTTKDGPSPTIGEIYPFYRGVRALGMGGAAVATVNDETSLFLNPAGLGKLRGPILTIADPELESTGDSYSVYSNYTGSKDFRGDPQQLLGMMSDPQNNTKHFHTRGQVFPSFVTTNFGFGAFYKETLDAEMEQNVANPSYMRTHFQKDFGAIMGFCLRLFDGRIKIGASVKAVNRAEVDQDIAASSTGLTWQNLMTEGGGVGMDAGAVLTAPWYFLPTLAATVSDVGDTKFTTWDGYFYKTGIHPQPQRQVVNAAFAIFPIHGNRFRSSWTVEYRDVANIEKLDTWRRVHAGVEFDLGDILFLRGGLNQRYYTAGIEVSMGNFQFQAATYGEEIGTPTLNREDRRYVGKLGFRF